MADDVLPASGVLKAISTEIDPANKAVSARFLGLFGRTAALAPDRGCVLDLSPDPTAEGYQPPPLDPAPWPTGDAVAPSASSAALEKVVDAAFDGAGDPTAANARGVAVVQGDQLLAAREGTGFEPNVALHGWSMTKTIGAMLFYKKAQEVGLDLNTPVVAAIPADRAPSWVAQWRRDGRAQITVADLLFMRDGLDINEGYDPTGDVVQMLYGEPDMSGWAAEHRLKTQPGTQWEYLSATSNILAAVTRSLFATDEEYRRYAGTSLFTPLAADSATLQTDTAGTWVASSYQWASVRDWAKFGRLMLNDGQWQGQQVIPSGWWQLAGTPAMASGPGVGYGAQTWRLGDPVEGACKDTPGVPADTLAMEGHWGQIVAMVPSRDAVVVRLGWTFEKGQFDQCQFVSDVLAALPAKG
jgi:CubicO group peptidase (beta-lactamase class C family)